MISPKVIFDFTKTNNLTGWFVTNDNVMGGVSISNLVQNAHHHGVFSGNISTQFNGGFCMVRLRKSISVGGCTKVVLRLKGDGKTYQLRIKPTINQRFWYFKTFKTTGDWQEVSLALNTFIPTFRGRILDSPNFNGDVIEDLGILIGNSKNEKFELKIDKIILE